METALGGGGGSEQSIKYRRRGGKGALCTGQEGDIPRVMYSCAARGFMLDCSAALRQNKVIKMDRWVIDEVASISDGSVDIAILNIITCPFVTTKESETRDAILGSNLFDKHYPNTQVLLEQFSWEGDGAAPAVSLRDDYGSGGPIVADADRPGRTVHAGRLRIQEAPAKVMDMLLKQHPSARLGK
ncbi:hypothetical protein CAPTEDRAFT_199836 [Capitella teleta]|uniref:Uncharacterized protein n=1 Tax=Capitella teleta TaxID=283909 RepID=R7VJM9_CAPTE|nr:hypothetical protein CAPTEDRAFT_199836 [Capitella teleta]|eukprot:ELU16045.1 hypothetical protein CAPTEDRAFT_199836 [Capitella teleta]